MFSTVDCQPPIAQLLLTVIQITALFFFTVTIFEKHDENVDMHESVCAWGTQREYSIKSWMEFEALRLDNLWSTAAVASYFSGAKWCWIWDEVMNQGRQIACISAFLKEDAFILSGLNG